MDEAVAAFLTKIVPIEKSAKWNQQSVKRTLDDWGQVCPDDFHMVVNPNQFSMAVGFFVFPSSVGQYGYDTGYCFKPDIEEQLVDGLDSGHLVEPFYDDWIENLQQIIQENQEKTSFSAKEYATFYAHRNPSWHEARSSDALGISVGTYRGKVGRVKSKLEEARSTLQLEEELPDSNSDKDWSGGSYGAPFSVLLRVEESRLPINSVWSVKGEGTTLEDLPVDELLL